VIALVSAAWVPHASRLLRRGAAGSAAIWLTLTVTMLAMVAFTRWTGPAAELPPAAELTLGLELAERSSGWAGGVLDGLRHLTTTAATTLPPGLELQHVRQPHHPVAAVRQDTSAITAPSRRSRSRGMQARSGLKADA
jgi:hypothetical protein